MIRMCSRYQTARIAVTDHNSDSQCNNSQWKNNGISCVSVRAEVAGVCNKDLINNIIQSTY